MKRKRVAAIMLGFCAALMLCSDHCLAQDTGRDTLKVKGANAMATMVDRWGAEFSQKNPTIKIVVTGGATAAGFEGLFEKSVDIVMASRKILEKETQAAAMAGVKPVELGIRGQCVAIVTHPNAPVGELTLEQLGKILTGITTQWSELGGPNEPITLITSEHVTGTAIFLRESVMGGDQFSADSLVRPRYHDMLREVAAKKPWAIAYCGLGDALRAAEKKSVKILAMKRDAAAPSVMPSETAFRDRTYPLIQPFYLYWNGESRKSGLPKFIDFCKGRL